MTKFYFKAILLTFLTGLTLHVFAQNTISYDSLLTKTAYQYKRTDFTIGLNASFTNPYDANEIALDLIITIPSGKSLDLPCFYVSGDTIPGDSALSVWNARFAAREAGTYTYHFQLTKNNIITATTPSKQLTVSPSADKGFIHAHSNWDFMYDNGQPFRGIGENVGWEARSYELQTNRYNYFLPKLAQNGANFFRTWMCNWNLPVECKQVINTNFYKNSDKYFNPGGITRMDQLVEMCDSLGLHMQLVLIPHGALITSGEWNINNYNSANGGPASTPTEFFTLPAAKAMFKNRLRYMVARWGYSPSIGAWELFNEIDNAAFNGSNATTNPSIPYADITQWHSEMSSYLKRIDIYNHLITTSTSWRDIPGLDSISGIDYNQQHIYDNTNAIPTTITKYELNWPKPYVIGEFGYDYNAPTTSNAQNFLYDFKRGVWYGLFTSTPIIPMTWWWEFFDGQNGGQYMTPYFRSLSEISHQMLLAGKGDFALRKITAGNLESYAVKCGSKYFVYLLNSGTASVTTNPALLVDLDTTYALKTLDPVTNAYDSIGNATASAGSLSLGSLTLPSQGEIVYIISKPGDQSGIETPFLNRPAGIPGKIEAEDYDLGGEGIAYHDYDTLNTPGKFRPTEGVDIDTTLDGSYDVTGIVNGEWLKYTVQVNTEGSYALVLRLAAADTGKFFRIIMNNQDITGPVKVPNTGGLQKWITDTVKLQIPKLTTGSKIMMVEMESSDFAIDYFNFILENQAPTVHITAPADSSSAVYPDTITITADASDPDGTIAKVDFYNGGSKIGEADASPFTIQWPATVGTYKLTAIATDNGGLSTASDTITGTVAQISDVPADTIQAENYDVGGEGVAYHDLTPGNKFGFYRTDDVDIEQCTDTGGGYDLGDFMTGEWVQYTVNVTQSGTYLVDFRVATDESGTGFSMSVDGTDVTGTIAVPNTGGWQVWTTLTQSGIYLSQGKHVLRLTSVQQYLNINYFVFSLVATAVKKTNQAPFTFYPNPVTSSLWFTGLPVNTHTIDIYNTTGQKVRSVTTSHSPVPMDGLAPGIYILCLRSDQNQVLERFKIVKQ